VTVSLRRMSAGSGYQYLLRSVAVGDGSRALSTPLTRYYSEVGTPPGRWLGSGVRVLGSGQLAAGMQVTEEQLALLIGMGRDPITGEQLGRAYPTYKRLADRIDGRVAALDPEMIQEVLEVMKELARSEMTLVVVTHEIGFAKEVGDRVLFFDEGMLIEENTPREFFSSPRHERSRLFLSQIM
jgi:hypothetical protein